MVGRILGKYVLPKAVAVKGRLHLGRTGTLKLGIVKLISGGIDI